MKKLFILFVIVLSYYSLESQTYEAKPFNFKWNADSIPKPLVLDSFTVNSFLLGFQWSGTPRMNQALRHNANAGGKFQYEPNNFDGINQIHIFSQPSVNAYNGIHLKYTDAHFIQYEPTLYTIDYKQFRPRPIDPTNAIFGFSNINGTVLSSIQFADTNYNRLILYKDSIANYPSDSIVLKGIQPNDKFETYKGTGQHDGFTGEKWNLSINLRRLKPHIDQSFNPTDTVLVIRLPYMAKDTFGILRNKYINFDKVPKTNVQTDTISLDYYQYRGYALDNITNTTQQNQLVITKAMLDTNRAAPDITISAHFSLFKDSINLDLDLQKYYNPRFHPGFRDTAHSWREFEQIQNIDIEVKYYGNCDVAIDWLRIETDKAQDMLRGKFDDDGIASGRNVIQSFLDTIPKIKHDGKEIFKIQRFYAQDSEKDNPVFWGQLRYYNLVTNGLAITRDNSFLPEHYYYYTRSPNRYLGMKICENEHDIPNPALRTTFDSLGVYPNAKWKYFGYRYGFRGEYFGDTLTSGFETFINHETRGNDPLIFNHLKNLTESAFEDSIWKSTSIQAQFGRYYYGLFHKETSYRFLYTGEPWYMNLFVGTNLTKDSLLSPGIVANPLNYVVRPEFLKSKTGEEIRLLMNSNILMGAKGIMYDRESNVKIFPEVFMGVGNGIADVDFDIDDLESFVDEEKVGGDFPNGVSDVYDYSSYINKDTISKYCMISPNRIYVGVKSVRKEIKHVNDWIRLNDVELMDLRLQASYSKEFRTYQNWNPYKYSNWGESPLKDIVKVGSVRTRKLFEPKHKMIHNTNPNFEALDSSFFDITLLQNKYSSADDLLNKKGSVYLGVMNRRTDPLIFRDSIKVGSPTDSLRELMFFTTAEFDDKVRFGGVDLWGVNQDSTWWQNQWWKRLGVREINIPLNLTPYGNGNYITAKEIGLDSLDQLGWRYDDKYYHRIDTTLNYNESLKAKLLPAQGKIIKLDFVPYFSIDPTEDSDTTNDHCYFCDVFNNFDDFKFDVVKTLTEEGCCYSISFTYIGDCTFEDIPFRLLIEGEAGNAFTDSNPINGLKDSLNPKIKYKDIVIDLDSETGTVNLGTFCVFESSNKYKISLLAGKDRGNKFIGCDRKMQFAANCSSLDPKDCCENLIVTDTLYSIGSDLYTAQYCTKLKVGTSFDSDCIYSISLGVGAYRRVLEPNTNVPIDFTSGSGKIYELCSGLLNCTPNSTLDSQVTMVKMQFLGKDGTVICETEVRIWLPCISSGLSDLDLIPPVGPAKASNEKQYSKTYESVSFKVTVWPNPTSGELNVEINSKVNTEVNINFISNIGASITNENGVTINKGVNQKTYNLKNYSSGVYYLQINGKDGNIVLPIMLNK